MLSDYHIHIHKGQYTTSHLRALVAQAMARGITELGIVEHGYSFIEASHLHANCHLNSDTLLGKEQGEWFRENAFRNIDAFIKLLCEAKEQGLPIKIGIEMDYFEGMEKEIEEFLRKYPFDYVIGSVHFTYGSAFDVKSIQRYALVQDPLIIAKEYFRLMTKAIRSNLFDVMGHFDVIKYICDPNLPELSPVIDEVLKNAKEQDICLELNSAFSYRHGVSEFCPHEKILAKCFYSGIPITLSSDAHCVEQVSLNIDKSSALAKKIGFEQFCVFDKRQRSYAQLG